MNKLQSDISKAVEKIRGEVEDLARAIHAEPEPPLEEYRAADLVEEIMERHGFSVERPFKHMPTALVASKGNGKPAVGILAEYDALPECGPGAKGFGHGCGHNMLGSASVCAAIAAADVLEKSGEKGTIKLFGTPAEETLIGKCYMARDGAFDALDACLGWHPSDKTCAETGKWAAVDSVVFEFIGKTAHGAMAHEGRSALDAVELMNVAVNYLREHVPDNVRIHYAITNGGGAPNVVPAYARVWYYVRGENRAQVDDVRRRVNLCAKGAATATETKMRMKILTGVYDHLPNFAIAHALDANMRAFGPPGYNDADDRSVRGLGVEGSFRREIQPIRNEDGRASSDEANVSWITPFARISVACWTDKTRFHSTEVHAQAGGPAAFKGMLLAGKTMAATAAELINDAALLKSARDEFAEKTRGFTYDPIIAKNAKPPVRDGG